MPILREQSKAGLGLTRACSCCIPSGFTPALGDVGQRSCTAQKGHGTSSRRERNEVLLQRNSAHPWLTQVSTVRSTAILAISTHTAPRPAHSLAFPCFVPLVLGNPVSKSIRSKPGWGMQPCPKGMHGYQDTGNPALTSEESAYRATRAH